MLTKDQINSWKHEGAFVMQLPSEVINPALNWLNNNFTLDQVDPDHLDFGSPDQKFEFPTVYSTQRSVAVEKTESRKLHLASTENDVRYAVRESWNQLSYLYSPEIG